MSGSRPSISLLLIWFVSWIGCSEGGGRVPVEGAITLDGQPLPGVSVTFDQPALGPNENRGYVGRTDGEGRYSLSPMMEEGSGVPPSEYRVSLTTAVLDPNTPAPQPAKATGPFYPESPPTPPERIPPAYRGGKLKFTVPDGGTDTANFDLKSK